MRRLLITLLVTLSLPVGAEQVLEQDGYVLHYVDLNSLELTPDIARQYGVERSKARGLVIMNLQGDDGGFDSVPAKVSGKIRNLIGQQRMEWLRSVQEQDAEYHIASFRFSHLETMRFEFEVWPDGAERPLTLKYNRQYYTPGR